MAKLGDICFQITDGSHNPPAGIENSKHLMLSSKNINDDEITTTAPRFLTDEQFDIENKRTNVLSGDLLMTIVGTVGRVWLNRITIRKRGPKRPSLFIFRILGCAGIFQW